MRFVQRQEKTVRLILDALQPELGSEFIRRHIEAGVMRNRHAIVITIEREAGPDNCGREESSAMERTIRCRFEQNGFVKAIVPSIRVTRTGDWLRAEVEVISSRCCCTFCSHVQFCVKLKRPDLLSGLSLFQHGFLPHDPIRDFGQDQPSPPCASASRNPVLKEFFRIDQLRHDFLHHVAMHVSEAEVAASGAEGELLVIEAKKMQNCGVKVVDVDFALDGLEAKLVRGPVNMAAFHSAASQPHREAVMIVVAAIDFSSV
jgi:hypothetical protein